MTSSINTNGLNVNYPVPGVNNNSQGFRDNFATIKTNLNTAATEITDLQNKVVVKQALTGGTVNNDMANTLISNALTRSFRASTYNLGNSLSGTVLVDASQGDVQYGTIAGNTILQFGGWAPSGTQSNVQLVLSFSNVDAVVQFPSEVVNNGNFGATTLENYANGIGNVATVSCPHGANVVDYRFSTIDCGTSITVEPFNRPRRATQLQLRTPPSTGLDGDTPGAISTDNLAASQTTCTATTATTNVITCQSTTNFFLDMPVTFTGITFGGITAGTIYYVRTIPTSTTFTVSTTPGTVNGPSAAVSLSTASGAMTVNPTPYLYIATDTFDATTVTKTSTDTIAQTNTQAVTYTNPTGNLLTVSDTSSYTVGYPISFSSTVSTVTATSTTATNIITVSDASVLQPGMLVTMSGSTIGGLAGSYYVKTTTGTSPGNITVSTTYNGSPATVTSATGNMTVSYGGVFGNVVAGNTYYVACIASPTTFSISSVQGGANLPLTSGNGLSYGISSMSATTTTDYTIRLVNTNNLQVNAPIMFSGNVFGGLNENQVYYINSIDSGNSLISVSQTRNHGVAGQTAVLYTANSVVAMTATSYNGSNIWKRLPLDTF